MLNGVCPRDGTIGILAYSAISSSLTVLLDLSCTSLFLRITTVVINRAIIAHSRMIAGTSELISATTRLSNFALARLFLLTTA